MLHAANDIAPNRLAGEFDRDGYVRVDPLFGAPEMERIAETLERFLSDGIRKMPSEQVYREDPSDPSSVKQLQKLFHYDPFFRDLMFDSPVRRVAEAALGEAVRPVNMQYFNKPPDIGKELCPKVGDGVIRRQLEVA